jgi:NADH dehydrogenase (ubiquinone) Fe-S protein 3
MLYNFLKSINLMVPKFIEKSIISKEEVIIYTKPSYLKPLLHFLKNHTSSQFSMLIDITAIDFPEREERFEVVYILLSCKYNSRLRIKVCVDEVTPIPSVESIHPGAGWCERETWDMFGIFFQENKDLRRILTDYGFEGYPLRKDFPLSGYVEVRYDDSLRRVVVEPLEMTQEFRLFDFSSPWEKIGS